jgi:hypothetical protein
MSVLSTCTYFAISLGRQEETHRLLQHGLRINIIYLVLMGVNRFFDLSSNVSCLWPYWMVVLSTFDYGSPRHIPISAVPFQKIADQIGRAWCSFLRISSTECEGELLNFESRIRSEKSFLSSLIVPVRVPTTLCVKMSTRVADVVPSLLERCLIYMRSSKVSRLICAFRSLGL